MFVRHNRLPAMVLVAIAIAVLTVTAGCGTSATGGNSGQGCKKIGVLMPDNNSSSRWESKDHPALQQAISAALPGASIDFSNANASQYIQLSQAETDLNKGDCILVVAAEDSAAASTIVQEAHNRGVPVIAYDRLIGDAALDYYVSFDGIAVGVAQGDYIRAHYQQYVALNQSDNVVLISGSQADNNALLFSKGIHQVLDPMFSAGMLVNQGEDFTQGWDNPTAGAEMDRYLAKVHDKLAIAYTANDGMASAVIDSLTRAHLNGKVLVTGQDATAEAIREILLGNQMMTVYKPLSKEAQATASLIAAISSGKGISSLISATTADKGARIPSVLLPVETVDKANIAATVLADGFVTRADICQGVPTGTDGIC